MFERVGDAPSDTPALPSVSPDLPPDPSPVILSFRKITIGTTHEIKTWNYQPRLNCTSTRDVLYLVDANPPVFHWELDSDFGKVTDFNQYVGYTLRTGRPYSYSQTECDFRTSPAADSEAPEAAGYCTEPPHAVVKHLVYKGQEDYEDYYYDDEEGKK